MHIGFLTPEYIHKTRHDGGLANYIRNVGLALGVRGHKVSVFVSSTRNASWMDEDIYVQEVKGFSRPVLLKKLSVMRSLLPFLTQVINARRLRKAVLGVHAKNPFNILQASSYMAPGLALRNNKQVPLVCRVSSYTPLLRSAYGRHRSFSEYLCDWLEVRQVLDADAAFAPSHFMANTYARIEGIRPEVVRTPVDIQSIQPDHTFFDQNLSGFQYLLFFGTLSRIKGIDLLTEVIPGVLENRDDLRFVFIGRDDGLPNGQKSFDYLLTKCSTFAPQLFYHPAIPKPQIYSVIQHALGVLIPSRVDNYPNACLEAQSFGIPVIGTDNSSLEEMIIDGETGFLACNEDPKSLQSCIQRLLSMTLIERQTMQKKLLASIQLCQTEDRVGQLIVFYEKVVGSWRIKRT